MFWRGTKVQSSGFNFTATKPSKAKPAKQSKAGTGAEKSRNAQPQAREAREAKARSEERNFMGSGKDGFRRLHKGGKESICAGIFPSLAQLILRLDEFGRVLPIFTE